MIKLSEDIHPIDKAVGEQVKKRRKAVGMSQTELATAVHLSFQQIQKYETGANRVSASKLYEISAVLDVPIAYFFGAPAEKHNLEPAEVNSISATGMGNARELWSAFVAIDREPDRELVTRLIKTLGARA